MTQQQDLRVGIVGLGAMGIGMACSMVNAGLTVKGYDLNPDSVQHFAQAGGIPAISIADTTEDVDLFVIVVVNADQAESVLFGENGAVDTLSAGSIVMLCSTVKPDFARSLAQKLADRHLRMLDAPISGGSAKSAQGQLTIMASGPPDVFDTAAPALDAMAEKVYRLGDECGAGSTVKMVNQLLAGVHIASAAEAMALGVKAGADPQQLYEVICNSAGGSWMFENRVPHMLAGDYTPHSAVEIFVKDLGIVLEAGKENRFPLPLSAAAHQMFLMAASAGYGGLDDSAVVKVFEQLADINVSAKSDGS